jgi:hypothetical protein
VDRVTGNVELRKSRTGGMCATTPSLVIPVGHVAKVEAKLSGGCVIAGHAYDIILHMS